MTEDRPANIPIWEIENSHPNVVDTLEENLSKIMDPELGLNIIQLGLVRNIEIKNNYALVTMILTTPFCPYGPSMMEKTRKQVEKALDMPTKIKYGRETWDPTMMAEGLADDWGLF
jgi:metal-sulfur cluster biosynthetic enzyme